MKTWVLKSEPEAFSIDDLLAAPGKTALWDGVRNYMARNNLVAMKKGDRAFFYHSNAKPTAIVGEMEIIAEAIPDATAFDANAKYFDPKSHVDKPRWFAPKVKGLRKFKIPLSREVMRETPLQNSQIFTNSRLSVIPLTASEAKIIEKLLKQIGNV
jgi:predicted RNA-binding protein with PUA-like domain